MRRSFSLVEVLVSVVLFFGALVFIMHPLKSASMMMAQERDTVEAQSAVEEAVHSFHVSLFGHETLSFDQLQESLQPKEVHGFQITYKVSGRLPDQETEVNVSELLIDVTASKGDQMAPLAIRRIYVCVRTG